MRGFRIFDHTEKVGGRRKEKTVWDRVCRSPEGALGEESIANASTTANRCFARSAVLHLLSATNCESASALPEPDP